MRRIIYLLSLMVFFVDVGFGQGWVGSGYYLGTTIDDEDGTFDFVATTNGIHIVLGWSIGILYRRYDFQGNYIQGSEEYIAFFNEMPKIFKMVEKDGDLYLFYKNGTQLLTKRSTDGGDNFSTIASPLSVESQSNGIDAAVEGNDIHVVWSELPSNETYYEVFDITNAPIYWDQITFKNVTDHPDAPNGGFPSIALSAGRVHVGFSLNTIDWPAPNSPDNSLLYSRDRSASWENPQTQNALGIKNLVTTTGSELHMLYVQEVQYSPTNMT